MVVSMLVFRPMNTVQRPFGSKIAIGTDKNR
jgi:hypothetical protein